jgi:predicted dithiol-disulfide oxidoreductase (DUF899 family)
MTVTTDTAAARPRVVSRAEWLAARAALLQKEKDLTHRRDALARERLALPWVRVEKEYRFETPEGERTLADLFAGRSQLLVYHFMFAPGAEAGCPSCSILGEHIEGCLPHLAARDVTITAVSRAPVAAIEAFERRMGWHFPWASSGEDAFNYDYGVSFTPEQITAGDVTYNFAPMPEGVPALPDLPGVSAFYRDADGTIYHTYSAYARGLEPLMNFYEWMDITPKGRHEEGLPWPMAWVRHKDRYEPELVGLGR